MQALGCVSEQVAMLVDRAALGRHLAPEGGKCLFQPSTAIDDQELWLAQPTLMRSSRTARHASRVSPPIFLMANSTF